MFIFTQTLCHLSASLNAGWHHFQGTDASGTKDVFLYNKSHLRLHGEPAPVEIAKPLAADGETCCLSLVQEPYRLAHAEPCNLCPEPASAMDEEVPHALDNASSPLIRALPQYERQFRWHLKVGQAL